MEVHDLEEVIPAGEYHYAHETISLLTKILVTKLWGYVKFLVNNNKPQTLRNLRTKVKRSITDIGFIDLLISKFNQFSNLLDQSVTIICIADYKILRNVISD